MDRKKILICDDDEGITDMLELVLEETGHEIITETNSLNIKSILKEDLPDLILLDLWMPVLSGDQVLKTLRADENTKQLPVIVISASRDGKEIALDAGATDFVAKPFDIDELLHKIEKYLNYNFLKIENKNP
ncbi:response regulator [Pedobacter sp. ASV12]|uniref:response regulator n=1 Tax=Pedobacter sp. ASV12 TaxID=2795120 RepID=UPI0018EB8EC1|nr:response regulator [Pedobacter sp. ASV12]